MRGSICVNARFLTQRITGVQRYAIEISRELRRIDPSIRFYSPREVIHKELADELGAMTIGRGIGHFWEQFDLPRYLWGQGHPLLLNLGNTAPIFYGNKVSVVHDIAFVRYPRSFSTSFKMAYRVLIPGVIKTSKLVATVSEFSKQEICSHYGVPESRLGVVYNAASSQFRTAPDVEAQNFVLAVSSISYQKNFISLIRAFRMLARPGYKLRVVGGVGLGNAGEELLREVDGDPRIEFLGRVSG
jgi:glycosyltransferase involved in cell wall biosynthesis